MKKEIVLSKRMEAVVNMVLPQSFENKDQTLGLRIADVGCDHAYVSIALMERGIASKVIAMDVRSGPLEIATRNVEAYGLREVIDLRLSDGMEKLCPGEVDLVIIAGMGGLLVKKILERGLEMFRPRFVLQPQSDLCEVRTFLQEKQYIIEKEAMLMEEGKYYTVIRAVPKELVEHADTYLLRQKEEFIYGRYGLQQRDRILYEFLQKESDVYTRIIEKLECQIKNATKKQSEVPDKTRARLEAVKEEQSWNQEALKYFLL